MANIWRRLPSGRIESFALRKNSNSSVSALVVDDFFEAAGGPATITGTLAVTEVADAAAFVGDIGHAGALAVVDGADVAAFSGDVCHVGVFAATDAEDTAAFSGDIAHAGNLSATDDADTFMSDGSVTSGASTITGDMDATEGADVVLAEGIVTSQIVVTEIPARWSGLGYFVEMDGKRKRVNIDQDEEDMIAILAAIASIIGVERRI